MIKTSRGSSEKEHRSNRPEGGGLSPSPWSKFRFKWEWRRPGGLPECPYFYRWLLDFGVFAIRLHKWVGSDDDRAWHDHPWWFLTFVLSGGYKDISLDGVDVLTRGSWRFRSAHHRHTVQLIKTPTWTLLITGPPIRRFGFWVGDKLIRRDKYFAEHGHHPCEDGEIVRMKPDGTRIL